MGNPFSMSSLYEVICWLLHREDLLKLTYLLCKTFLSTWISFCLSHKLFTQVAELAILAESNSRLYHVCGLVSGLIILLLRPFSPSTRQVFITVPVPSYEGRRFHDFNRKHVNFFHRDKVWDWAVVETKIWGEQWFENNAESFQLRNSNHNLPICLCFCKRLTISEWINCQVVVNGQVCIRRTSRDINQRPQHLTSQYWSCL